METNLYTRLKKEYKEEVEKKMVKYPTVCGAFIKSLKKLSYTTELKLFEVSFIYTFLGIDPPDVWGMFE